MNGVMIQSQKDIYQMISHIYDESVDERIIKGGSWINEADSSYVADSFHFSSSYEENTIGFRIVRTAIPKK